MGSDVTVDRDLADGLEFQSTGPVWDPTSFADAYNDRQSKFQSTGPVWDPTR